MRKLVSVLLTLAVAVSLMLVPAVISANPGAPTIDGVIDPVGEWDGATVINTADDVSTVSVMADVDYLYVLFVVVDSTDAREGENLKGNDQTSININPTPGDTNWGKPCDIIFQTGADNAAWSGPSSGTTDGWLTDWEIDGVQELTLPTDLKTMTLYDKVAGTRISEWKLPLASIAGLQPGDILDVGGTANVGDGTSNCYPPELNVGNVAANWGDLSIFVDILVQGNTVVGLTAETPTITAINVDPTSIDFGTVNPGDVVSGDNITVENIGTVKVDVDADLNLGTVFDYLQLNGAYSTGYLGHWDIIKGLLPNTEKVVTTQLVVPSTYSAQGSETTTLVFEATAV